MGTGAARRMAIGGRAMAAALAAVLAAVTVAQAAILTEKQMLERAERVAREQPVEGFPAETKPFYVDGQLERVEVWYMDKFRNLHYKAVVDAAGNVTGPTITPQGKVYKFLRQHTPPTGKSTWMGFDTDLHGMPFINYVRVVDDDNRQRARVWFDEKGEPYKGDAWAEDGRHTWGVNNPGGRFVNKDPGTALQPVPAIRIATQPCEPCRKFSDLRNETAREMNDLRTEINATASRHARAAGQEQLTLRMRYDVLIAKWLAMKSELETREAAHRECEKRCRPQTAPAVLASSGQPQTAPAAAATPPDKEPRAFLTAPVLSFDTPTWCNFRVGPPVVFAPSGPRIATQPSVTPKDPVVAPTPTPQKDPPTVSPPQGPKIATQPPDVTIPPATGAPAVPTPYPGGPQTTEPPPAATPPPNENPVTPSPGLTIKATQAAMTGGGTNPFVGARIKLGLPDPPLPSPDVVKDAVTAHDSEPVQGVTGTDGTLKFRKMPEPPSQMVRGADGTWTRRYDARGAPAPWELVDIDAYNASGPGPGVAPDEIPIDLTPRESTIFHCPLAADDPVDGRTCLPPSLHSGIRRTFAIGDRMLITVDHHGPKPAGLDVPPSGPKHGPFAGTPCSSCHPGGSFETGAARGQATGVRPLDFVFSEPNLCREKKPGPADPYLKSSGSWKQKYDDQWAIKRAGLTDGAASPWAAVAAGKPVIVAVVDTGLDWDHQDIARESLWTNDDEVPGNGIDDDKNGYVDDVIGWDFVDSDNRPWDRDGHGTFVAGVIAAAHNDVGIAGINPNARLMVLRALNDFGHTRASYLAEAIVYAANNGARVINVSVGGKGLTRTEQMAVDYARQKGALVVAAAGNEAEDVGTQGPASAAGVLVVSATGFDDARAPFSNWGTRVDVSAPGLDVLSLRARATDLMRDIPGVEYTPGAAYVGADKRYYRASGTSFSAPIVSGIASLVWSARPELTADEVRRVVLHSARDVDAPGRDQYTGYGLVDAAAALRADPRFFLEAEISGVKVAAAGGKPVVEVSGTAHADRFRGARLEIGAGASPRSWTPVGAPVTAAVQGGVLGTIPAASFAGAKEWTIRLVAGHQDGKTREARFSLKLE